MKKILIILLSVLSLPLIAQNSMFDKFKQQQTAQFDQFKADKQAEFDAFRKRVELTSVTIPNCVNKIGMFVF